MLTAIGQLNLIPTVTTLQAMRVNHKNTCDSAPPVVPGSFLDRDSNGSPPPKEP